MTPTLHADRQGQRSARSTAAAVAFVAAALAMGCHSSAVYLGSDRAGERDGDAGASGGGGTAGATGRSGSNGSTGSGMPGAAGTANPPGGTGMPSGANDAGAPPPIGASECPAGFGDCDGNPANGCETDVRTTVAHCGGCNKACPRILETIGSTCVEGVCNPICELLHEDCDGRSENGCEAHLWLDSNNCGACGVVCACNGMGECR